MKRATLAGIGDILDFHAFRVVLQAVELREHGEMASADRLVAAAVEIRQVAGALQGEHDDVRAIGLETVGC